MTNLQGAYEQIGKSGCYFLSLLKATNQVNRAIELYSVFKNNNWMDEECFIKCPVEILRYLTGEEYTVVRSNYYDPSADIIVAYYYNPRTKCHHFVLHDNKDKLLWDSFGTSVTVREGHVENYRLFYRKRGK